MTPAPHSAAIQHLPPFITAPGETDVLFWMVTLFVLAAVLGIGVFYFKLHSLPERLAHRGERVQFQLVAVLGLISLLTHNHAFWIAGLLLAIIRVPDFMTPLRSMAHSMQRLADALPQGPASVSAPPPPPQAEPVTLSASHGCTVMPDASDGEPRSALAQTAARGG